ncbi:hypothetical protein [Parasedimentitalea maritima]|uniref:Type IV pilus biogenesis protein PilP n=1 Tax=Parasedimentitalea maritima TaxID=2578117 RepID=A0A6A4R8F4_9RHOB|nr:hypothetical protein [Zongyanglinia marina]KAE9627840.1 hypothetical protein GP644_17210 [Zongyanglinia marina]
MKPGFALSLSPDGISLLHRAAGGWRLVGSVGLDVTDLSVALTDLQTLAQQLDTGPISCKLIIPNGQIRYLTIDTGDVDDGVRMDMARAALDGATPYPVDELAFDLSQDGELTHVAAVAIETLDEAETFASDHGFIPTSFVAAPGDMDFLGEPFFGTTRAVRGIEIEPDGIAVVNVGPAEFPQTPPENKTQAAPKVKTTEKAEAKPGLDEPVSPTAADAPSIEEAADEPKPVPIPGFSSRRGKQDAAIAPPLQGASREPLADELPIKSPSPAATSPEHPELSPTAQASGPAEPSDAPLLQFSAPSVTGPDEQSKVAPPVSTPDNTAFLSRRQTPKFANKTAKVRTVSGIQPTAVKQPSRDGLGSDPFALREPQQVGGKPKFLGLALIAVLLLFMAAAAAWAVFTKGSIFFFGPEVSASGPDPSSTPDQQPISETQPDGPRTSPVPEVNTVPEQVPEILAPQVSALPENLSVLAVPPVAIETETASLSGTDSAVLDALRQPLQTDLDPEAVADGVTEEVERPELSQAAQYAATGIWQSLPDVPELPAVIGLSDLYVASIDNTDLSQDAVALPATTDFITDTELDFITSPVAAGNAFDLDERGLVRATPEGTLNPDGVMVYLGRPSRVPPPTPNRPDPEAEAQIDEQQAVLALLRPRARPDDLVEQAERAQLGGLSLAELGQKRPRARPASSRPANEDSLPTTAQAIATSVVPKARPVNFANLVDRAQRNTENIPASASASTAGVLTRPAAEAAAAAIAPETVTPSIPTSASVARQATLENSINLRKVNLIGVYGTPSNRRALVRLSSGRYKKVKVGDRIDGGQVVAIGDAELRYQKGGRNVTLKIPNG